MVELFYLEHKPLTKVLAPTTPHYFYEFNKSTLNKKSLSISPFCCLWFLGPQLAELRAYSCFCTQESFPVGLKGQCGAPGTEYGLALSLLILSLQPPLMLV